MARKIMIALGAKLPILVSSKKKPKPKQPTEKPAGLSLGQIMKTTPGVFKSNAGSVMIRQLSKTKTRSGLPAIKAIAKVAAAGKTRSHNCSIISLDAHKPIWSSKRVYLDCACEAFTFWCEYALNKHGAAALRRCNGEPPVVRNPKELPMMCKHLVELSRVLKEHNI